MKVRHIAALALAAVVVSTAYPQLNPDAQRGLKALEDVGKASRSGGGGGGSGGGDGGDGGNNNNLGGLGVDLPLQSSQKVFTRSLPRLVNDVRVIVGLPPLRVDEQGNLIDTSVNQLQGAILDADRALRASSKEDGSPEGTNTFRGNILGQGDDKQPATVLPLYIPPERPQVIYNSDQNALWVVATRKQHKWVAEYLSKVDKPQTLIAIEVKFLETKKNPQTDIGVNWENTFGSGLTIGGQASIGSSNSPIGGLYYGSSVVGSDGRGSGRGPIAGFSDGTQTEVTAVPSATNDLNLNGSGNWNSLFNTMQKGVTAAVPYSAVLSLDQFSVTLQAFMRDRDSSIVQYPRVLTMNNREVAITSAEYTPLNVGTSTAVSQTGTAGTTVGSLQYLPTGTQINILPKIVNSNQIALTVAITVSSVIGELPLNLGTGVNLYPITASRVYNASLQVDSGYTLAVGGLEKVDDRDVQGGIPVLKDIPGLGYLFKNINKKRDKANLLIFLTPYLIGDPAKTPGISETPQSIVPLRPGVPPQPPTFTPDGKLSGGEAAVPGALAWLDFQLRYFRQVNLEALMTLDSIRNLRDVIAVARALSSYLQVESGPPPYDPDTPKGKSVLESEQLLTDLNIVLATAQDKLM